MTDLTGLIARLRGARFRLSLAAFLCVVVTASQPVLWPLGKVSFTPQTMGLSHHDQDLYKEIFALQKAGKGEEAKALVSQLEDPLLVGHVLYQRYMVDPTYHSSFNELNDWLRDFGDHPFADKVYRLASQRHQKNDDAVVEPVSSASENIAVLNTSQKLGRYMQEHFLQAKAPRANASQVKQADKLALEIKNDLNRDRISKALLHFNDASRGLTEAQQGVLLAQIAMGFYQNGKFSHARLVALRATRQRGPHQPIANWVAGLAAWQLKDAGAAEQYFARIAHAENAEKLDRWFYSGAAFWAARAAGRQGDRESRLHYLQLASAYPTTFYGLLAHAALGRQIAANVDVKEATADRTEIISNLSQSPVGERLLALLDIDEKELAIAEAQHWLASGAVDAAEQHALLNIAKLYDMPELQQAIAQQQGYHPALQAAFSDEDSFPVLQEAVATSKEVDPALIHALIRQESRFNPKARNASTGATGLMQLMPKTAKFMGSKQKIDAKALLNPSVNLQIGQRYVSYLLRQPHVDGNLFYLAVAYNAGPGNLQSWQNKIDAKGDPLLFIESLPFGQTRNFVEHVMTNYWIYRMRLGQGTPDVQALVDGAWPRHPEATKDFTVALVQ